MAPALVLGRSDPLPLQPKAVLPVAELAVAPVRRPHPQNGADSSDRNIEVPWNLTVGAHTVIGDEVVLYCLGAITLGDRVTVSQYAHLCAGTHDHTRADFPLLRHPITIGDDAWIATDVFVGPGVTIGAGTVVGARSNVFRDLPAWKVCVGSPAKPVKDRILEGHAPNNGAAVNR